MRHVSEGQLRAYHDGALTAGVRQRGAAVRHEWPEGCHVHV